MVKVVKKDAKFFVVTSNVAEALLYMEDIGPVTFFGHKISYIMASKSKDPISQTSRLISTLGVISTTLQIVINKY